MLIGVVWALLAGLTLGLYPLPSKYVRDFRFENTWGLFFLLTMFVVPVIATFTVMKGVGEVFAQVDSSVLVVMVVSSFLWGTGVMMWGKAIDHIGVSLGFSLFIGTVILVGSLLPFFVDGLPPAAAFETILMGILLVLAGVFFNGKAGMTRESDEAPGKNESPERPAPVERGKSMAAGIAIAVIGGLLATGFSLANAVGRPQLQQACVRAGNPEWVTAIAVMFPIFLSGGVATSAYFLWTLSRRKAWPAFRTPRFGGNLALIFIMALFHYAASALFAYAAFRLGEFGNTVGYAIFNTASVIVAVLGGLLTREWARSSRRAKTYLWGGLACMVLGIIVISAGNGIAARGATTPTQQEASP